MTPPYTITSNVLELAERIGEAIFETTIPTPQENPTVSPQVTRLLAILEGAMSRQQILHALGQNDRESLRKRYLQPALEHGFVKMARPESPTAKNQKYRHTARDRPVTR